MLFLFQFYLEFVVATFFTPERYTLLKEKSYQLFVGYGFTGTYGNPWLMTASTCYRGNTPHSYEEYYGSNYGNRKTEGVWIYCPVDGNKKSVSKNQDVTELLRYKSRLLMVNI